MGQEFGLTPNKIATKLFLDAKLENRVIKQNFNQATLVNSITQTNGQIFYVKIEVVEPATPAQDSTDKLTLNQVYELSLHPTENAPGCAHDPTVYCMKCMKAHEERLLIANKIPRLEWDEYVLSRQQKIKREGFQDNTKTLSDIKHETINSIQLTYQDEIPVKTALLSPLGMRNLQDYVADTYFRKQFCFYGYGAIDAKKKQTQIEYISIEFYRVIMQACVCPQAKVYEELRDLTSRLLRQNFGLEKVAIGFTTEHIQFTKHQIIKALKTGMNLMLHVRLCDANDANKKRKTEDIQAKYKVLTKQTWQLQVKTDNRDAMVEEAYYLNDCIRFLHKNDVIDQQIPENPFELRFKTKQIIDNQFKQDVDTDCFITPVGSVQQQMASKVQTVFKTARLFDVIELLDESISLEENIQRFRKDPKSVHRIVEQINGRGAELLNDPTFQMFLLLNGVEVIGKDMKQIFQNLKAFIE